MAKLSDMSLDQLYERKPTKAVWDNIQRKEDFTQISNRYCDKVCILKDKCVGRTRVSAHKAEVVILQDYNATNERYKTGDRIEIERRKIINFLIKKHFPEASVRIINILRCSVTEKSLGNKRELTTTTLLKCSPYALAEIDMAEPKVIIALTTNSLKALGLSKYSSTGNRGEIASYKGIPVVVTLHPKYTTMIRQNASGKMWGPDFLEVIDRDFEKAGRILRGDLVIKDQEQALEEVKKRMIVTRSLEEVKKAMGILMSLPEGTVISYDLETNTLDPYSEDARILTAQFGFRGKSGDIIPIVVPLWHRCNDRYIPEQAWPFVAEVLVRPIFKVGHNMKFDVLFTAVTQGVRVVNVAFDTMLLLHDINSGIQGNYGLKRAVWDFIPETGLGGYEDRLPPLSTESQIRKYEEEMAEDD